MKWKRMAARNEVLMGKDFFVSYNGNPNALGIDSILGMFLDGPTGGPETALYKREGKYLILNGDFRAAYEKVLKENGDDCYEKCLEVYNKHKETSRSGFSED